MIRLDTDNGIYLSKASAQYLVDGQKQTGDNITIISSYVKLLERSNYIIFNPLLSSGTPWTCYQLYVGMLIQEVTDKFFDIRQTVICFQLLHMNVYLLVIFLQGIRTGMFPLFFYRVVLRYIMMTHTIQNFLGYFCP